MFIAEELYYIPVLQYCFKSLRVSVTKAQMAFCLSLNAALYHSSTLTV